MERRFLDSNILLRYFTRDDEEKAERALALLQLVERGVEQVETSPIVIFEVVFTLHRRYRMPRGRIRDLVAPIIDLRGLRLDGKAVFARALDLFAVANVAFGDAFNVATMEARGIYTIYSWDADFDRFPGLTRVEPDLTEAAE